MTTSGPHPQVKSSPCGTCGEPATDRYKCVDCGMFNCKMHMNWCKDTDGKIRCPGCYKVNAAGNGKKK